MSADANTRPQGMTIRSQDNEELLAHTKWCLEQIKHVEKQFKKRNAKLVLVYSMGKVAQDIEPRACHIKVEIL